MELFRLDRRLLSMNCTRCREALSASADEEASAVGADAVDRHLRDCAACEAFARRLRAVGSAAPDAWAAAVGQQRTPSADLTAGVVARLGRERLIGEPRDRPARPPISIWQMALAALGIGQCLAALPVLVATTNADALHANHDLGAVELALGACFLLAALRPRRAAGFVPLLAAVVACLTAVAIADVGGGHIAASSELPHLVDVLGLVLLVAVARRRPAPVLRPGLM